MQNYMDVIQQCPLFAGIAEVDLQSLLECLTAVHRHYPKGAFVFRVGEPVTVVGIVLSGDIHILQEDFWGNRTILADVGMGGLFGEAFSCGEAEQMPVSAIAAQPAEILLIDYRRVTTTCTSACAFHTALIQNMLRILANKNILLTQKMEFVTRRTTREKLLAYLSAQAQWAGSNPFSVPFSRQELAEYLSVDRSAMSHELSKMQADGILTYRRNWFELLRYP